MPTFCLPAGLTRPLFAALAFFLLAATPLKADELPPFVMPKIAPWPKPAVTLPAAIGEKDLPAVTAKAEAGDTAAILQLVRYYGMTDAQAREPRDTEQARAWNKKAAEKGDPEALFLEAMWSQYSGANEADILRLQEKAANAGHGAAAFSLAWHYQQAGQPGDAVRWYRKSVQNGHVPAASKLGAIYFPINTRHTDIRPDIVTAYAWLILAQRGLEDMPDKPEYGGEDNAKSNREKLVTLQFYLMPSEKKQAEALVAAWPEKLPPEGDTRPFSDEKTSRRGQPLPEKTVSALYKKATAGDKDAIREFIFLAFSGGIADDEKYNIMAILMKGNALGIDEATNLLALSYIKGSGVEKNSKKGHALLQAQAKKGDPQAFYLLGLTAKEDSANTDEGRKKALSWFEKGAAKGSTPCMLMLGHHFEQEDNDKQAAFWFEKAVRGGSENALMSLLGLAESARDMHALGKWMGVIILRHSDPMVVYRTRGMLLWTANSRSWDDYQKILREAEKWHKANPLPKKKPNPLFEG